MMAVAVSPLSDSEVVDEAVVATTSHESMVGSYLGADESTTHVAVVASLGPLASWKATVMSRLVTAYLW